MTKLKIGFLHPGAMGISLAATAKNSGHTVFWASEERSRQTHARAAEHNLVEVRSLNELCDICSVIVCVCPPHAAEQVARQTLEASFDGLYLDANAISPQRAKLIGRLMDEAGVRFIDGGIIGGPAWEPGRTWLYLSGEHAERVTECFSGGPLETCIVGEEIGSASALKMCYAAYTKGTTALLCAILATAEELGVRMDLQRQWSRNGSDFADQAVSRVRRATVKAWRFTGEMDEIAATFAEAGVPAGFHEAAGEIYCRLAHFKAEPDQPSLEEVLEALVRAGESGVG
jgi:3-hydroxyisobutyrate dehydrogenase-like beta-hydroxyacid dehydrogenase